MVLKLELRIGTPRLIWNIGVFSGAKRVSELSRGSSNSQSSKQFGSGHTDRSLLSLRNFALFLFLLAIYLATYRPQINSSDGLAMFATADSLVRRGETNIEQIRWLGLQQGSFGLDGLLYSRKGIGLALGLVPLTWLGLVVPWFGTVGTSLLFNAIVTALTAVLLGAYLLELGYNHRTGLIVALTFGVATLAWPYAKSLFSDPLSGLLLLGAAYSLLKYYHSPLKQKETLLYPFLAGLGLGWNVATRYAEILFVPIFGLLLIFYWWAGAKESQAAQGWSSSRSFWLSILAFSLPLMLTGVGLVAFNIFRFGDPLNTGYLPNETFSGVLWDGILGQLVSPGRGLLLYCPILILSLLGVVPFFRLFRAETTVAASIIIIHLLLYGKWFMWHGGYAWGPRFMIPTLPFWAMFLAPVVDRAFSLASDRHSTADLSRNSIDLPGRMLTVAYLTLFALSLVPQILGTALDFAPFQNALLDANLPLFDRQTFFDPRFSPLIGGWAFVNVGTLDLAWAWGGQVNWWLLAVLAINVVFAGYYLFRQLSVANLRPASGRSIGSEASRNYSSRISLKSGTFLLLPLFSTIAALIFLLGHTHTLPEESLRATVSALNEAIRPVDVVITNDPSISEPFAELYKGRAPVLGLNNGGFPLATDVSHRLDQTILAHPQLWWLPNWLPPDESAVEQTLLTHGFRARDEIFGEQRLSLFAIPPAASTRTDPVDARFGGLLTLTEVAYAPAARSESALPVELHWQADTALTEDYHIFVHLMNSQDKIIAQADGQPALWSRPTSTWNIGETVIDRHGLWVPAGVPSGAYQLRIGLYRSLDGSRLQLPDGTDSTNFEVQIE
jgi:hypothetical protein